jgi:hypothetical protein
MAAYLITRKDIKDLETVVFPAGERGKGEAVPAFTDPNRAQRYIEEAGWQQEFTVAELEPVEFLKWLLHCHVDGIETLVTDPEFHEQQAGRRITTLDISAQLEHAALHILQVASPDF